MSDAVLIRFIEMLETLGVSIVTHAGGIFTAAIAALISYMTWRNGQKAEAAKRVAMETKTELKQQVAECKDAVCEVREVATRSHHEVTQAFQAGERSGYVRGIPEGRKQASGPMPLGD